jgi:hypothetical protein
MRRVDGRNRDGNRSDPLSPKVTDQALRAIGDIEHHFVVGPDTQFMQGRGKAINELFQFPVGVLLPEIDNRRFFGVLLGGFLKPVNEQFIL